MSSYHNSHRHGHHHHPSVSFEDSAPTTTTGMDSDLMNGGPVGPFDGEYVNGHSTNGTTSPSTPGFHKMSHAHLDDDPQHHHTSPLPKKKLFSTGDEDEEEEEDEGPSSVRTETWPGAPLPPLNGIKHRGPRNKQHFHPHSRHPAPSTGGHPSRSHTYTRVPPKATDTKADTAYPRISRPVELLRSSYDCVVIGSGYGGAVAASRAARAGESVCVLELGKERWPGEYPVDVASALDELHYSGTVPSSSSASSVAGALLGGRSVEEGDPTGMYHLMFGKGQNAMVCNGELFLFLSLPFVLCGEMPSMN